MKALPHKIRIYPSGPLKGSILPPSSKYRTLRCVLAAVLATGESKVFYPAISEDTDVLIRACMQLGAKIQVEHQADERHMLTIEGTGGILQSPPHATLDVGNAGAVLRLLLGICALSTDPITFTTPYPESLGRRPNDDLVQALVQLGATVESRSAEGRLPVTIQRGNLRGGCVQISGKKSSQFISALLFLGPLLPQGLEIEITGGLVSASFIELTIQVLAQAGIMVLTRERYRHYTVPGRQRYQPREYSIPGDYPSAAALLAAVAVTKGEITLQNLPPGEADEEALLAAFSAMGMALIRERNDIIASAKGPLHGINLDGNQTIDSVPVLAAAACFAGSPSRIYNVAHLRLKESDRINALATELSKAGCHVVPSADAIDIYPVESGVKGGTDLEAHTDHRLIEALTVVGLGCRQPVTIYNAQHIAKSYPHFFDDLAVLGARVEQMSG